MLLMPVIVFVAVVLLGGFLVTRVFGRIPARVRGASPPALRALPSRKGLALALGLALAIGLVSAPTGAWALSPGAGENRVPARTTTAPAANDNGAAPGQASSPRASDYASREQRGGAIEKFEGGSTTVVIGSSALVVILVVVLILVLI